MDNAKEVPLDVHLGLATQGEAVQPHDLANVGKGWFGNRNTKTVQSSANRGVNLPFHLFGEGLFALGGTTMEIGHLPDCSPFRMAKAG